MILNPRKRRKKAFGLAFKIIGSYLKLKVLKPIYSAKKHQKKLNQLHKKNATRIKNTILELNGLFIKIGQLLSILSNVIPKEYGEILESLQDKTPHSPFSITKQNIEKELNDSLENLFQEFEEIPIASASIGQVHKAKLKTGEWVAVKIKHPYIKELAKVDLDIIEKLHKRISLIFKVKGLEHAISQVKIMITEELNYEQEAQRMIEIKENCQIIEGILIPTVFTEFSSSLILTSTFYEGTKITNVEQLHAWGINPEDIAQKLVYTYCEMLMNQGVYHADPHPGNLMVNKEGDLIFLDFGAVGELKEEMRANIPPFIQAILSKDNDKIMDSLQKMEFISKDKKNDKATLKIVEALTEFLQDGISMDSFSLDNIKESSLFKLQKELSIKELTTRLDVPKDWILLERTLLLLYGICTTIAPDYSAMKTIKPYLQKLVLKDGGLKKIIINTIKNQVTTLLSLPTKIDKLLTKTNRGELEVKISNLDKNTTKIVATGRQLLFGLLAAIFLIGALISSTYQAEGYESIFQFLSIAFGSLLIFSFIKNRK